MIKYNFIKNKIKKRYKQFAEHPLISNAWLGIIKYIYLNLRLRLKKKPIIMRWTNNLKYHLSLGDGGVIGNYYFYLFEYQESIFLIKYLKKIDTFVDVGSNHGHYTLISSGIVGAKTISIEPVKNTFRRLKMNVELNSLENVELIQFGISNADGYLHISNDKGPKNRIIEKPIKAKSEKIKVTTLDKLLENEGNISVIKIDVEGYERQVLEGSIKLLMNHLLNVIIIELNNSNEFYNYHEKETLSILEKYGFKPYTYSYKKELLIPLVKKNFKTSNTIFIRNINIVNERINNKSVFINRNQISIEKTVKENSNIINNQII
tara:strand:+ start:1408 stop:2367 length:960 start_codon:yes stop_codon:yes gene_type:complete